MSRYIVRAQSGGTFFGVVLGLMIGLGVSVLVSLYITNMPLPFIKNTQRSPNQIQITENPNKALRSKVPLQSIGSENLPSASVSTAQSDPEPLVSNEFNLESFMSAEAEKRAPKASFNQSNSIQGRAPSISTSKELYQNANKKNAQVLNSRTTDTTLASNPNIRDTSLRYYLQIGAFKSLADAEQQRAKAALQGAFAVISERVSNGLVLYRVRLGPYQNAQELNEMRVRLSEAGIETAVIQ